LFIFTEENIFKYVTGQQEVHTVVRKLRKAFPLKKNKPFQVKSINLEKSKSSSKEVTNEIQSEKDDTDDDLDAEEALRRNKQRRKKQIVLPNINLDEYVRL